MWSSSDLQGGYPTQWMLNPSAYQNVSNEEVDWASLAQQWIKMKETFPAEQVPPAPPPPPISGTAMSSMHSTGNSNSIGSSVIGLKSSSDNLPSDLEGGEAPMDMDTKEDNDGLPNNSNSANASDPSWGTWNNWQQWGWGGNWPASGAGPTNQVPGAAPPIPSGKTGGAAPPSSFPYPGGPSTGQAYNNEGSGPFEFNNTGEQPFNQQGYWMGGPAPYIKQKGADWRHDGRHVVGRPGRAPEEKSDEDEEAVPVIDAAKRKQLPAWIREGLEKMEKEKLKKQERERMQKERELEIARQKELELQQEQNNPDGAPIVIHSKFDTESEDSEAEEEGEAINREPESQPVYASRKSRFDQNAHSVSPSLSPARSSTQLLKSVEPPQPVYRTKEEIMQETMRKVRIVLTDILMSVTSEELDKAANETLSSMRAKAPAKQHRKTPALTSLTGKLGLGIYNSDDDSDESDEGSDNESTSKRDNVVDSDEELKERWLRRKQEFARIESDIILKIEEQEEKERRQLLEDDRDVNEHENDEDNYDNKDRNNDKANNKNDGDKGFDSHHHHRYGNEHHQVEAKQAITGKKQTEAVESVSSTPSRKYAEEAVAHSGQDEHRTKRNGSQDQSEGSDRDNGSSDSSNSSGRSESSNSRSSRKRHKHSSSKKRKNKKDRSSVEKSSNKSRRKRSRSRTRSKSRGSDRKTISHRKTSHDSYSRRDDRHRKDHDDYRHRYKDSYHERSGTRDRDRSHSRDRRHTGDYRHHRHSPSPHRRKHYSSSSSHKRRRSSSSPESIRSSKRSSGRDRDYDYRRN